jgi:LPXTG-motif cell wall-anchored protein
MISQTKDFQVNQAGAKVIQIKLISLSGGIADLSFKKLSGTVVSSPTTNHDTMIIWLIVLVVVLLLVYVFVKKRRRKDEELRTSKLIKE